METRNLSPRPRLQRRRGLASQRARAMSDGGSFSDRFVMSGEGVGSIAPRTETRGSPSWSAHLRVHGRQRENALARGFFSISAKLREMCARFKNAALRLRACVADCCV